MPLFNQPEASIGGIWGFPGFFLSGAYVTCIYCGQSMKIHKHNTCEKAHGMQDKHPHVSEDHGGILFAFVSTHVVDKDPNTPNWSFIMAGDLGLFISNKQKKN